MNRLMNSVHSLSTKICMKEKLFTSYKIRMASLILFITQAIFSSCKIYGQFAGEYVLLNSPMEGALQKHLHSFYLPKAEFFVLFSLQGECWQVTMVNLEVKEGPVKNFKKKQLGNWSFDALINLKVSGFQQFLHIWQLGLHCYALLAYFSKDWLVRHQTKNEKKPIKQIKIAL